jgi:cytochrome c553
MGLNINLGNYCSMMEFFRMFALTLALAIAPTVFTGSVNAEDDPFADVRETLELCTACHGEGGAEPIDETIPILAGQHLHYLYVQLKDFKSGLRENEIMAPIAGEMEKKQMLLIAEYFSLQTWPRMGYEVEDSEARIGHAAAGAGQCVQCHLGGYDGASRVPRLAGQSPAYLEKTMLDFKTKARNNSPAKSALLGSFGEDQISAMAAMMAGL